MFQPFVPTPFEGWGEYAHDGTPQELLAVLIVSVGALALTLCVAFFLANALNLLIRVASLYRPV
jgi:hypothetical protein